MFTLAYVERTLREVCHIPTLKIESKGNDRYSLTIIFPDESSYKRAFSMRKSKIPEFLAAHEKNEERTLGSTWHDYLSEPVIKTQKGKISFPLYCSDLPGKYRENDRFTPSPELAQQLISALKEL